MFTKRRSFPVAVKCALLSLAFAVFGLGLHAKLSLSKANRSSATGAAKLSIEDRSAQILLPYENRPTRRTPAAISVGLPFEVLVQGNVYHFSHYRQVELSLCTPRRYDSLGADRLHLPPPTLS